MILATASLSAVPVGLGDHVGALDPGPAILPAGGGAHHDLQRLMSDFLPYHRVVLVESFLS
jgi:hypothetical protein